MSPLLAAVLTLAVLTLTPGPDLALTTRAAASGGVTAGVGVAVGVVGGLVVWGSLVALGVGAILTNAPAAARAIQAIGGVYLLALGVGSLRRAWSGGTREPGGGSASEPAAWRAGLLGNLLNPKIAVFYLALLPRLVPPGWPVTGGVLALVGAHVVLTLAWLGTWSAIVSRTSSGHDGWARPFLGLSGVVLVAFGLRAILGA